MQKRHEHQHGIKKNLSNITEFKNKPVVSLVGHRLLPLFVVIVFGFFVVLGKHASKLKHIRIF